MYRPNMHGAFHCTLTSVGLAHACPNQVLAVNYLVRLHLASNRMHASHSNCCFFCYIIDGL